MHFARGCTVVLGLVAFAIALRSSTIQEIIETASSIGSAGPTIVTLLGLFATPGGPAGSIAATMTGAGV